MSFVADRALKQTATLWRVSPDKFGGDLFSAPEVILCRWVDKAEKFISPLDSNEYTSNSIVHVQTNMLPGDYLFLGETDQTDPTELPGAFKIQRFDKIPNLRNLMLIRKAYL